MVLAPAAAVVGAGDLAGGHASPVLQRLGPQPGDDQPGAESRQYRRLPARAAARPAARLPRSALALLCLLLAVAAAGATAGARGRRRRRLRALRVAHPEQ